MSYKQSHGIIQDSISVHKSLGDQMPGHTVVIVTPGIAGEGPGLVTNTANIILTTLHNHTPHLLAVNQSLMQDASSVMQI